MYLSVKTCARLASWVTITNMTASTDMRAQRKRPRDTWSARITLIRRELRLNRQEIAELCGVDDASWGNWERGSTPRQQADVSRRIAERTGYDLEWLLWGGPLDDGGGDDHVTGRLEVRVLSQEHNLSPFRRIRPRGLKVPA